MNVKSARWIALSLGVFFAVWLVGGLISLDPAGALMAKASANDLKPWARIFSRYGDFPFLLGGGVIALAIALASGRPFAARVIVAMILAGVIAGTAANAIKLVSGRVRPRVERVESGWYGPIRDGQWVSLEHDYQAFPSSHSACAFGFFVPLVLSRRVLGMIGLALASGVAWSRVYLGAHHVSDVAAGALIGVLSAWFVWRWIVARGGLLRWLGPADQSP